MIITDYEKVARKIDYLIGEASRKSVIDKIAARWQPVTSKDARIAAADSSRNARKLESFYVFAVRAVGLSGSHEYRADYLDVLPVQEHGEDLVRFIMESVEAKTLSLFGDEAEVLLFDGSMSAAPSLVPVFPSGDFYKEYRKNTDLVDNYMVFFIESLEDDYKKFSEKMKRDGFTFENVVRSLSTEYHPGDYVYDAPNYTEIEKLHKDIVDLIEGRRTTDLARDMFALMVYIEYVWSIENLFRHYYKIVGFAKTGYRKYILGDRDGAVTDKTVVRATVKEKNLPLPGFVEVWHWVDKTAVPRYLVDLLSKMNFRIFLDLDAQVEGVVPHKVYYMGGETTPVFYVESFDRPERVLPKVQSNISDVTGYPILLEKVHNSCVIGHGELSDSIDFLKSLTNSPFTALIFGRDVL